MRFSLTDEQVALRDAVRELFASSAPDAVWGELARMGVFGALVPESAGGLGLSDVDVVPILAEIGYAAPAAPVAETLVAAPLLVGDPRLASVLNGSTRVAIAGPSGLIPFGGDLVLLLADQTVRLVKPTATEPRATVDPFRPLLSGEFPAGGAVTADPALVGRRALLATSAQLVGLGRRMLDLTVSYVNTRHQFGVPVGSFQAVKHHLADALLQLEFAWPAVLAAGWALSTGAADAARSVAMASVLASEAAQLTARTAIQCHGAIGYTVEYELHRFAKRAWALAAEVDVDVQVELVASSLHLSQEGSEP